MVSLAGTSSGPSEEDRSAAPKPPVISWGSAASVDIFEKVEQIGEGTYGEASSPPQTASLVVLPRREALVVWRLSKGLLAHPLFVGA